MHTLFHLIQWILRSFSFWPLKKLATIRFNSMQKLFENLKQLIAKIGIASVIDLIKISSPLWQKFALPRVKPLPSFTFNLEKALFLAFLMNGERPRYFSYYCGWIKSQSAIISSHVLLLTFLLKTIVFFSVLIHYLKAISYILRISNNFKEYVLSALQKKGCRWQRESG